MDPQNYQLNLVLKLFNLVQLSPSVKSLLTGCKKKVKTISFQTFFQKKKKRKEKIFPFNLISYIISLSLFLLSLFSHSPLPTSRYNVQFKALQACKLNISQYLNFEYDIVGSARYETPKPANSDDQVSVEFSLEQLYIPL